MPQPGLVIVDPSSGGEREFSPSAVQAAAERSGATPRRTSTSLRVTADGDSRSRFSSTSPIPSELDALDPAMCDGIGLVRTELLFDGRSLPDEEQQLAVYRRHRRMGGRAGP